MHPVTGLPVAPAGSGTVVRPVSARGRMEGVVLFKSQPSSAVGAYITPKKKDYEYVESKEEYAERTFFGENAKKPKHPPAHLRQFKSRFTKWTTENDRPPGQTPGSNYSRETAEITLQQIFKARARANTARASYKSTWK